MKHQTYSRQELISGTLSSATPEPQKIEGHTLSYNLNHIPYPEGTTVLEAGDRFHRVCFEQPEKQAQVISDQFEDGSVCEFTRLFTQKKDRFNLRLTGNYS